MPIFPGQPSGLRTLRHLSRSQLDWKSIQEGKVVTFDFTPAGEHRTFLAVAHPLRIEGSTFGALVVAKPKTALRSQWLTLMKFFGVSLLGGLVVAAALAWYLSRRITKPVLGLSRAADQVDLTINPNLFPQPNPPAVGPSRPAFNMIRSDMWIQSLNVGLEWSF